MPLSIWTDAPEFKLESTSGKTISLKNELTNQAFILFFYPKDFTPGCTKEVCDFRDSFETFKNLDIRVFGVSTDSVKSHLKFQEKHRLQFELLSDANGIVSSKYDALIPVINLSRRITYLIDKNHKIAAVYSDMFGARNHLKAMIEELNKS